MSYLLDNTHLYSVSGVIEAVENDSVKYENAKCKHNDETAIRVYHAGFVRIHGSFAAVKTTE